MVFKICVCVCVFSSSICQGVNCSGVFMVVSCLVVIWLKVNFSSKFCVILFGCIGGVCVGFVV